jgi:hypothetical protein
VFCVDSRYSIADTFDEDTAIFIHGFSAGFLRLKLTVFSRYISFPETLRTSQYTDYFAYVPRLVLTNDGLKRLITY